MEISGESFRIVDEIAMSRNRTGLNMIVKICTKEMSVASRFTRNDAHIVQTSHTN